MTATTSPTTEKKKPEAPATNGKWTAERALAYLLDQGAVQARDKWTKAPILELPDRFGLKMFSAIDFLKRFYGVKYSEHCGVRQLLSLGKVLQFFPR